MKGSMVEEERYGHKKARKGKKREYESMGCVAVMQKETRAMME